MPAHDPTPAHLLPPTLAHTFQTLAYHHRARRLHYPTADRPALRRLLRIGHPMPIVRKVVLQRLPRRLRFVVGVSGMRQRFPIAGSMVTVQDHHPIGTVE